jgi:hypothetical protein
VALNPGRNERARDPNVSPLYSYVIAALRLLETFSDPDRTGTPKKMVFSGKCIKVSERLSSLLGKDIEKSLLEAKSPFVFSSVNERSILRFLKLIACDNSKIGTYVKLVDDRNESAHSNGNIFYSTQAALDIKVIEILRVVDEIQCQSKSVIEHCYREFLLHNHDPDEREYPDLADQIREVLIHGNYLSQRDIEICLGFDLYTFAARPEYKNMRELHDALVARYGGEG